jgi:hypothetical protein
LVTNLEGVIWAAEQPSWRVNRHLDRQEFGRQATSLWRRRWSSQVQQRLDDKRAMLPGVADALRIFS